MHNQNEIKETLDYLYEKYHTADFIENDPICIPHLFSKKEDIEIMSFLVSLIAWGNRNSIIKSGKKLIEMFDNSPYDFIVNHSNKDLKNLNSFVHRTFNLIDLISMIKFLKEVYLKEGLESVFSINIDKKDVSVENGLNSFYKLYNESKNFVKRTDKHIAAPSKKSACKRLNMFLRWMVRKDDKGVDFGIWNSIKTNQLVCPLDVHVIKSAFELKLISESKSSWMTALELTQNLKQFDKNDPVKYDYALFMMYLDKNKF